jgi:ABC-type branched-subunit amino acid transport system substrate-binding protein
MSGVLGIAGPSVLNCALLAAEHVAERADIQPELVLIDAGQPPQEVARTARQLVDAGLVDGLVGSHTSDVRAAVSRAVGDRVPYVFTPPHERDTAGPSTVFTGTDPRLQIRQPLEWITRHHRVHRWALIGNDYIWPRQVHRAAAEALQGLGQSVVMDRLVPLGAVDTERLLDDAWKSRADAVLLSLVGRDGIIFQREAAASGADQRLVRLSTALDENCLVAAEGDETGLLYSAMPSFILQQDDRHQHLLQQYVDRFGPSAPQPGSYAEGCYDGVALLAELRLSGLLESMSPIVAAQRLAEAHGPLLLPLPPPRAQLARAEGYELSVIRDTRMV